MAQPAEAKEVWSAGKQWQNLSGEKGGSSWCRELKEKITKSAGLGNGQRWKRFWRNWSSLAKAELGIWMQQWNSQKLQENNRLQSHSSSDLARISLMLWLAGPDCSGHCLGQTGRLFLQETPSSEISHLMNKDAAAIYSPFTLIFHFLQLLLFKHALLWSPLLICLPTFIFFLLSKSVKDIKEGVMKK